MSRSRAAGSIAAAAAFALLLAAPLAASTVTKKKDLHSLCEEAQRVFAGKVKRVESHWVDQSDKRAIETLVTFNEIVWLRGGEEPEVTLRFPGGSVEGIREAVAGIPEFRAGQRALVLTNGDAGLSPLVGFNQGYFPVVETSRGPVVLSSDRRPMLRTEDGSLAPAPDGTPAASLLLLDELIAQVRRELDAQRQAQ